MADPVEQARRLAEARKQQTANRLEALRGVQGTVPWHEISADDCLDRLHSDAHRGLTSQDAAARLGALGANRIAAIRGRPAVLVLAYYLLYADFSLVMWVCVIGLIVGYSPLGADDYNLVLAGTMAFIVIATAVVSVVQRWRSGLIHDQFTQTLPKSAEVLRDGKWRVLDVSQLTLGDVVRLAPGSRAPADLRLISNMGLKQDSSALTGESTGVPLTTVGADTGNGFGGGFYGGSGGGGGGSGTGFAALLESAVSSSSSSASRLGGYDSLASGSGMMGGGGVDGFGSPAAVAAPPTLADMVAARNMVLLGTSITEGTGTGVVVSVGDKCALSRIIASASYKKGESHLARDVKRFALIVAPVALVLCVVVFLYRQIYLHNQDPTCFSVSTSLSVSITLMVAIIPEELPVAVTFILLRIATRLQRRKRIAVTQLANVETLGSVSAVVLDKTGTLTENQVQLSTTVVGGEERPAPTGNTATSGAASCVVHDAAGAASGGASLRSSPPASQLLPPSPASGGGDAAAAAPATDAPSPVAHLTGTPAGQAFLRVAVLCNEAEFADGTGNSSTLSVAAAAAAGAPMSLAVGATGSIAGGSLASALGWMASGATAATAAGGVGAHGGGPPSPSARGAELAPVGGFMGTGTGKPSSSPTASGSSGKGARCVLSHCGGDRVTGDNSFDVALLTWADANGVARPVRSSATKIASIPYSSGTKYAVALHALPPLPPPSDASASGGGQVLVTVKGATSVVLRKCALAYPDAAAGAAASAAASGPVRMTPALADRATSAEMRLGLSGHRVIALAEARVSEQAAREWFARASAVSSASGHASGGSGAGSNAPGNRASSALAAAAADAEGLLALAADSLTFIGLAAFSDPVRETSLSAITAIKAAGIRTIMVTGDHHTTALSVARRVGMLEADPASGAVFFDTLDNFVPPEPLEGAGGGGGGGANRFTAGASNSIRHTLFASSSSSSSPSAASPSFRAAHGAVVVGGADSPTVRSVRFDTGMSINGGNPGGGGGMMIGDDSRQLSLRADEIARGLAALAAADDAAAAAAPGGGLSPERDATSTSIAVGSVGSGALLPSAASTTSLATADPREASFMTTTGTGTPTHHHHHRAVSTGSAASSGISSSSRGGSRAHHAASVSSGGSGSHSTGTHTASSTGKSAGRASAASGGVLQATFALTVAAKPALPDAASGSPLDAPTLASADAKQALLSADYDAVKPMTTTGSGSGSGSVATTAIKIGRAAAGASTAAGHRAALVLTGTDLEPPAEYTGGGGAAPSMRGGALLPPGSPGGSGCGIAAGGGCGPGGAVPCGLSPAHWDWILSHPQLILARTTPEQKLLVVQELKKRGQCVASVGDGVNDALAMRQADVGIAMNSCSDLLREAADIVLLHDDLNAFVDGVAEGRRTHVNLKKMFAYQLPAGCAAEVAAVVLSAFSGLPLPLSCFQMILLCVGTDLVGGLSLAYAPEDGDLMSLPPRDITQRMFSLPLWAFSFLYIGAIETLMAMGAFFGVLADAGISVSQAFATWKWEVGPDVYGLNLAEQEALFSRGQSAYFIALVMIQLANLYQTAAWGKPFFLHNGVFDLRAGLRMMVRMRFLVPIAVNTAIALAITQISTATVPTEPAPAKYWGIAVALAVMFFCIEEARKWLARYLWPRAAAGTATTAAAGSSPPSPVA